MSISLYADDAVIYCSSYEPFFIQTRLERALLHVMEWCNNNYININIDETKFCIYGTRANVSKFNPMQISANGKHINRCHQYQVFV